MHDHSGPVVGGNGTLKGLRMSVFIVEVIHMDGNTTCGVYFTEDEANRVRDYLVAWCHRVHAWEM